MFRPSNQSSYATLMELLQMERDSLLSGRLEAIATITEKRDSLLADLSSRPEALGLADLQRLQDFGKENNALYKSALEGLGAARARVDGWLEAEGGLTTYNSDRTSRTQNEFRGNHEKRA